MIRRSGRNAVDQDVKHRAIDLFTLVYPDAANENPFTGRRHTGVILILRPVRSCQSDSPTESTL